MIDPLLDNVFWVLIFLGMLAAGLAVAWWNTRKRSWLVAIGGVVAVMALLFVLSRVIVTDRMQLSNNVDGMRSAINAGKLDEAVLFFDDKVVVKTTATPNGKEISREALLHLAKTTMSGYQVKKIITGPVHVDALKRPDAEIRFAVRNEEGDKTGWCTMKCKYKDGKWRVTYMTVESLIGGQTAPVLFPL
jgi:hypothetical protein